jgi:hypothetical protein
VCESDTLMVLHRGSSSIDQLLEMAPNNRWRGP